MENRKTNEELGLKINRHRGRTFSITHPLYTNTQYPFIREGIMRLEKRFPDAIFRTAEIPDTMQMGVFTDTPNPEIKEFVVTELLTRTFNRVGRPAGLVVLMSDQKNELHHNALKVAEFGPDSLVLYRRQWVAETHEIWWIKETENVYFACLYEVWNGFEFSLAEEFFWDMAGKLEEWE